MKTIAKSFQTTSPDWHWSLLMAFIRLPLILAGSGLAILAYQWAETPAGIVVLHSLPAGIVLTAVGH
jgi:hypothetical protein